MYITFLVVSLFAGCALSDGDSLLVACSKHDIDCLSKSTEKFLEKTSNGIPEYDFRAIDPMIILSLDHEVDANMGLVFHLTNLNITGLKNQKISDFQMDTDAKSVVLKTKADLHVVADITIDLKKDSKTFSGLYTCVGSVFGTARYSYTFRKDDKGVEFFEIGPETITCEVIEEPSVTLSDALQNALDNDSAARKRQSAYNSNKVAFRKATLCNLSKVAYVSVVHNIRAAAKILPKTAFLNDV